jgi:signal transduction histidine kinase
MRRLIAALGTISGRIVLGVVVLQTTFGVVAGYTIWQMNQLGRNVALVKDAYLAIAPDVAFVQHFSAQTADDLDDALTSKAAVRRGILQRNRDRRREKLSTMIDRLAVLTDVPRPLEKRVADNRAELERLRSDLEANNRDVDLLFSGIDGKEREAVLRRLGASEEEMAKNAKRLLERLQYDARWAAKTVEDKVRYASRWAVALGAIASLVALLVTAWAVVTLRPLARLTDGARRVARGEYKGRVDATGGTEIAELAREFNTMAQAIEEREQELVRSARLAAVGRMAAVITHEVRNPLSSIGLNAELLEDEIGKLAAGGTPTEARALLVAMQSEVDRLTAITEEYLRFARLPRPKLERESVNDVVTSLLAFTREELAQRKVRVVAEVGPDLPEVNADEQQLRQALLNLVRNAADAMPSGGTLTVRTQCSGEGAVEIRVVDTGPGIAAEHLARIFEPFYSTKDGGTGLGLALTQQIVLDHGGKIAVDSGSTGTSFVVSLPAA